MARYWFAVGALLALLAMGAGAFGAHALESRLSEDDLDIWQTAARYHVYHALGLLAVAFAADKWGGRGPDVAGWLFVAGILLFSGSLYLLSLTGVKWLGAVTPLGGVAFLGGWAALAVTALRAA